jgi:hypothetical protein
MQIVGELCEGTSVANGPTQRNPRVNRRIHQRASPPERRRVPLQLCVAHETKLGQTLV